VKPLTHEERAALARSPIRVGILAEVFAHTVPGMASAGTKSDTPKLPVQNFRTNVITGWMSNEAPRT
jgi:hypothetical protein